MNTRCDNTFHLGLRTPNRVGTAHLPGLNEVGGARPTQFAETPNSRKISTQLMESKFIHTINFMKVENHSWNGKPSFRDR